MLTACSPMPRYAVSFCLGLGVWGLVFAYQEPLTLPRLECVIHGFTQVFKLRRVWLCGLALSFRLALALCLRRVLFVGREEVLRLW